MREEWTVCGTNIVGPAGTVAYCPTRPGDGTAGARRTARLIAAAPEMLRVLYRVVGDVQAYDGLLQADTIAEVRRVITSATNRKGRKF